MESLKIIPLGGIGTVTRNMYVYEYGQEILIVDCGIGFVDDTMPGVDLEIPDVTYLKKTSKKIVGMLLTHGHEDHIGALPFILPTLPQFPVYATKLTAALANDKLGEFGMGQKVQTVEFGKEVQLGMFNSIFLRVTHSILDTSHIFIRTPVGNMYHGSDFKFDFTPVDGQPSDLRKIARFGDEGILCLLSDCLGAERAGHAPSESVITDSFDEEVRKTKGKVFITTFSSNLSRMNQAIEVAQKYGRKICFVGRSFIKNKEIGKQLGYMKFPENIEIKPKEVLRMDPSKVLILLAGSQGQVESGLVRIANNERDDISIGKGDTVIFSADPIPGNEIHINSLVDTLSKKNARVIISKMTDIFHVSGHGGQTDLELLISLTNPKFLFPIGGTYRHMTKYRDIAGRLGYSPDKVILVENNQPIEFYEDGFRIGKKVPGSNVYVDQISGEELDNYIIHDRIKIANEGLVVIITEIDSETRKIIDRPTIITKGFVFADKNKFESKLFERISTIQNSPGDKNSNILFFRKTIQKFVEELLYREGREPLIIPIVLEV